MTVERKSDHWVSLIQSVLLHGVVVGALAYGFYAYKTRPQPVQPTLAVEGAVVESKSSAPPAKAPEPLPPTPEPEPAPEPPPEDVGPPAPSPDEIRQREETQKQEQEKAEQQRRETEERVALERQQAEQKAAAEQKQREEDAERKRKQEAEEKRVADAKRKAEEKRKQEEAQKKAAEERAKAEAARIQAERDSELRKSLEAEERANAIRSSGALQNWLGQIGAKVQRAWIRPPGARPGISCVIRVTQTPGGEVTNVSIGECNGDAALRESIESAVYRASPLPPAPDPAVFDRNLAFTFRPND